MRAERRIALARAGIHAVGGLRVLRVRAPHPELLALAAELGEAIAERGWTLVSGGGNVSAMGALAAGARAAAAGPSA